MKSKRLTEVKFIGRLSKMDDKIIIVVPTEYHKEIKLLKGKQLRVRVDDEIW